MNRTTVRLREPLLAEAKRYAVGTGRSMTAVIEDALIAWMARGKKAPGRPRKNFTTVSGRGLRSGVDLDDSAALRDLMEGLPARRRKRSR